MATPAMDSASLLREELNAFRIKVIAHLMTHEGLFNLDDVKSRLAQLMESASEAFYLSGSTPSVVSANSHHLRAWETISYHMSADDLKEFNELNDLFSHWAAPEISPRSPEYEAFYTAKIAEKDQKQAKVIEKVTALYDDFDVPCWTDRVQTNEDIGRLIAGIWMATGEEKNGLFYPDIVSLIVKIWEHGGTEDERDAAKAWCKQEEFDYEGILEL